MNHRQLIRDKRERIREIAAERGVTDIRVFGSVARGEEHADSDIDFLVELEPGRTLLDIGGLISDLRDELGCEVDVTTRSSVPGSERERLEHDARPI